MYVDFHTHYEVGSGVVTPRSLGVHPWRAGVDGLPAVDDEVWREVDVVGECGLDRLRGPDMDVQMAVFEQHIIVAEQLRLPLVVHCVRAFDVLLSLRKRYARSVWVVHGFRGGVEMLNQLRTKDIGVSIGAAIVDGRNERLRDAVRSMGCGDFFLETDVSRVGIEDIYSATAALLGVEVRQLQEAIVARYEQLLAH